MKEIKAIIRPSKLLEVTEELHEIEGLPGVTLSEIKGSAKAGQKTQETRLSMKWSNLFPE